MDKNNINNYINEDIFMVLKNLIANYESQNMKSYIGTVIDNKDPDNEAKIKCKINGLYDGIEETKLPWILPKTEYTDKNRVKINIPEIDSNVTITLQNGDIYKPIYSNSVISVDAKNTSIEEAKDNPDLLVIYENEKGDFITIDRKTSEFKIGHNKGITLKIDTDGALSIIQKNPNTGVDIGSFIMDDSGIEMLRYNAGGIKQSVISAKNDGSVEIKNAGIAGLLSGGVSVSASGELIVNDGMVTPSPIGPLCSIPICPISGASHLGYKAAPGITNPGAI